MFIERDQYTQYNESFKRTCTFKIGICSGFFSEYNNMILAMVYCLRHHIRFQLTSDNANFNPLRGWDGFFLPFCKEVSDSSTHSRTWGFQYALKRILFHCDWEAVSSLYPYLFPWKKDLKTQDVFGKCRDRHQAFRSYNFPQLAFQGNLQELCAQLVHLTWHYNEQTQTRINTLIEALRLPQDYVSIHVRRGDKIAEANHTPLHAYLSKLGDDCDNLFVASDDYAVVEEILSQYPQWHVWTLCEPTDRGYQQAAADLESPEEKERSMITLFATMEVLNRSKRFVGTYSSNMGMFMGMRNPQICVGVDYDHWLIW